MKKHYQNRKRRLAWLLAAAMAVTMLSGAGSAAGLSAYATETVDRAESEDSSDDIYVEDGDAEGEEKDTSSDVTDTDTDVDAVTDTDSGSDTDAGSEEDDKSGTDASDGADADTDTSDSGDDTDTSNPADASENGTDTGEGTDASDNDADTVTDDASDENAGTDAEDDVANGSDTNAPDEADSTDADSENGTDTDADAEAMLFGSGSKLTMTGGKISNNIVRGDCGFGGGISIIEGDKAKVSISGGYIINNRAAYGGGVCVYESEGCELTISGGVVANNTAATAGADIYAASSATLSLSGIEYVNTETEYEADDNGLLIDSWYDDSYGHRYGTDGNYEIKSDTADTDDDGRGGSYTYDGTASTSNDNIALVAAHAPFGVYYDANASDATGSTVDTSAYDAGETVTVKENGFTRTGYTFTGWNTAKDGSGIDFIPGTTVSSALDAAGRGILSSLKSLAGSFVLTAQAAETDLTKSSVISESSFYMPSSNVILYRLPERKKEGV